MTKRCIIWIAVSSKEQAVDEKASLSAQENDALAIATKHDWQVVDILRVSGFSRDYLTLAEFAAAALTEGIDAGKRLQAHFAACDFDVFICRDADRFGREQSIVAEIASRIVHCGAAIYSLNDGWVSAKDYRMWAAMVGYRAASDIDRLVQYRKMGATRTAERLGITAGNKPVRSHKVVRGDNGDAIALIVNEEYRRLFEDAARLLLEGVGWAFIEQVLYERFGHVNRETGKPYASSYIYKTFHAPTFWGHGVYGYRSHARGWQYGSWCFDPAITPPEDVEITYNTHEPMLTGELAVQVQAEMHRRIESVQGRRRPGGNYLFTGLLRCGECGHIMRASTTNRGRQIYYLCETTRRAGCRNRRTLQEKHYQALIDQKLIQPLYSGVDLQSIYQQEGSLGNLKEELSQLYNEVTKLETRAANLIRQQADNPELAHLYRAELKSTAEQVAKFNQRISEIEQTFNARALSSEQAYAVSQLLSMSHDAFWERPGYEVNQILHSLLGKRRFIALDGDLVGFSNA